jgi:hypothetical protein
LLDHRIAAVTLLLSFPICKPCNDPQYLICQAITHPILAPRK